MAGNPQVGYITQRARQLGLDPEAVLAIAGHEGMSGGIGDGGHAFGPFQENNAGGVLTGRFAGQSPAQLNAWAWSHAGIDDALGRIAGVARGLKGQAAVTAIARQFERPANPGAEISDAMAHYGHYGAGGPAGPSTPPPNVPGAGSITAGGSLSRQQLASLAFSSHIDFGSNQVQAPNLSALIQARAQQEASPNLSMPTTSQHGAANAPVSGGRGVGLARTALTQIGQPYQWGGKAVLGGHTDCSGLLQASARANGINIGRTTYQQWQEGQKVDPAHLLVGDAVFFHMGPKGPEHVGVYAGAGKFVEDPHTGSSVRLQSLANYPGFVGARRYT
jgi:cell wall-associated NlpC family hydrolase